MNVDEESKRGMKQRGQDDELEQDNKKQKQDSRMEQDEPRRSKRIQEDLPTPQAEPEQYGPKMKKKSSEKPEVPKSGLMMLQDVQVEQPVIQDTKIEQDVKIESHVTDDEQIGVQGVPPVTPEVHDDEVPPPLITMSKVMKNHPGWGNHRKRRTNNDLSRMMKLRKRVKM